MIRGSWYIAWTCTMHCVRKQRKALVGRSRGSISRVRLSRLSLLPGHITLVDGRVFQSDLIIGADGIHSLTVEAVTGAPTENMSTGKGKRHVYSNGGRLILSNVDRVLIQDWSASTAVEFVYMRRWSRRQTYA
ncbi:hypothetical protein SNOG_20044 [Parastagonospora nodorum SN15]|uniref:FAD-binding domain-containing protein n=1 Tax=Phaeosphaeria nodorum (strain SN15 / ATCC MYA-4574 / FGSC 10173) TaxID=321614 RepID=A9JX41_PHANO|nr:hypothetical protein SNOG_20044 [Parastagonospora nodorum SN15]EDP89900.1 hypothetical protein SNOG_20044 [Parastagonospora nodorum SN15]